MARRPLQILRSHWAAVVIIALAATGYSFALGRSSLWYDEAYSAAYAALPWSKLIEALRHSDGEFIVYYAFLHVWRSLNSSDAMLRVPSVAAALVTLGATYALAQRLFDKWIAVFATIVLATNPLFISLARDARSYTMAVAFATVSGLAFVSASTADTRRRWLAYAVASIAGVYAHLFAALVILAHIVYAFTAPEKVRRTRLAWTYLAITIATAPAFWLASGDNLASLSWIPQTTPAIIERVAVSVAGSPQLAALDCILLVVAITYVRRSMSDGDRFFWCWLLVPVIVATALSFARPMLIPRYFSVVLPALSVLVARGLCAIQLLPARFATAAIAIAFGLLAPRIGAVADEDWRGAVALVRASATAQDALVAYPPDVAVPVMYYLSPRDAGLDAHLLYPEVNPMLQGTPPFAYVDFRRSGKERIWLFLRNGEVDARVRQAVDQLGESYELHDRVAFQGVLVLLWTPRQ